MNMLEKLSTCAASSKGTGIWLRMYIRYLIVSTSMCAQAPGGTCGANRTSMTVGWRCAAVAPGILQYTRAAPT